MISSLQLDASWRDYWNLWGPACNALIAPIADSRCFVPRVRIAPSVTGQIMPPQGKIEYNLNLPPGSLIWCLWAGPEENLDYTFQLTDIATGHKLFQEPSGTDALPNSSNAQTAGTSPFNYAMLPSPWPVVGEGLFTLEIWGTPGLRYYLLIGIAEVEDCE